MDTTVLVAEDDRTLREVIRYALMAEGYRVSTAATVAETLTRLAADRPQILLLDILMDEDGTTVANWVRDHAPEVGVITTTPLASTRVVRHPPGHVFLAKPFTLDELLQTVASLCAARAAAADPPNSP